MKQDLLSVSCYFSVSNKIHYLALNIDCFTNYFKGFIQLYWFYDRLEIEKDKVNYNKMQKSEDQTL